jgi:TolB protein
MRSLYRTFASALLLSVLAGGPVPSQEDPEITLEVTGKARRQIPIVIPPLRQEGSADASIAEARRTIRDVLETDLAYSGIFNVLPPSLYAAVTRISDRLPLRDFAAIGAQAVVGGTVGGDSTEVIVEGLLFDARSEALITGKRYRGAPALARDIAHRIADDITVALTGRSGVSTTRLVMVGRPGGVGAKEIFVSDYDGADLKQITKNGSINVSPAWSPDGRRLAFVSYRQGNPKLYIYSGEDGSLVDASPPGSELCVAPDWSPDGRYIAFSSSSSGDSEIFVLEVASGSTRKITFSRGSDTAPVWSPSGREVAFTSDRSGSPQIYIMSAEGANTRRVTTSGRYNDSAAWSPEGGRIAYVSRIEGRFEIMVHDIASGETARLTSNSGNNENPRWSPDGRHIVFSSNRDGVYRIYTMDDDGNRPERVSTSFEATMPDWSR